jgi:hypothetical protein
MCQQLPSNKQQRRGLSVVELLVSIAILAMISLAIGMLSSTVYDAHAYNMGNGEIAQHARAVFTKIDSNLKTCTFNTTFPGWLIIPATNAASDYPDTLVIWKPLTAASNPTDLPTRQEIIVYCPNPAQPNELWEMTDRTGPNTTVPATTDLAGWRGVITSMAASPSATKTVFTPLLRTALDATNSLTRGVIRFRADMAPSQTEFSQYAANTLTWNSMNWPLGIYGNNHGVVCRSCYIELQTMPRGLGNSTQLTVPFFWSTSISREVTR